MRHREIEARLERVISACREEGVEPTPESVAQIMVEEDENQANGSGRQFERTDAYGEYHKAATWVLVLFAEETQSEDGGEGVSEAA